jgi:hypothetical protein
MKMISILAPEEEASFGLYSISLLLRSPPLFLVATNRKLRALEIYIMEAQESQL